ncbi:alpha/beta fold hydrolase [Actinokineospora diospyrosa]|uniref:Pimeloyl-ACP methyl ester carboxylesterase n=1 Tax=Actinokineospora diospyrosa TaxID=103728 RepID=A0ABT1I8Y0_9PSEU|nr:alpha/beta fold hydrolase [Actinokineospora diospyrosa]MCP2268846.1 Pimeloyl-ACP methyl ester carboxylesterase [Actinokineospora diospyrosa]
MDNAQKAVYVSEGGRQAILERYRRVLDGWPVAAAEVRVPTREGETFVVVSGEVGAPPVVLLHGAGTNAAMWAGDVAAWAEHFRVYAVDVIGEPGLSAASRPELGSGAYAGWLDDVFDHFGLKQAAVVGASLGGWLALDYATRRVGRVERLVLLCPGGVGRQKTGVLFKALLYKPFGKWGMRRSIKAVAGVDAAETPEVSDYLVLTFTHFRPRREQLPIFSDEALQRLTMPVLAIVGEQDAMLDSRGTAKRLEHAVPQAQVNLLPGVAHSIIGQTQQILDFLRA